MSSIADLVFVCFIVLIPGNPDSPVVGTYGQKSSTFLDQMTKEKIVSCLITFSSEIFLTLIVTLIGAIGTCLKNSGTFRIAKSTNI